LIEEFLRGSLLGFPSEGDFEEGECVGYVKAKIIIIDLSIGVWLN
jgi:hypothetical protein